jgi:hypothetical protein
MILLMIGGYPSLSYRVIPSRDTSGALHWHKIQGRRGVLTMVAQ